MSDIATKLDEARALVERGWAQGECVRFVQGRPHYCALGAICKVVNGHAMRATGNVPQVKDAFTKATDIHYLPVWNDSASRTQAEVIEAFHKAAAFHRRMSA